MGSETPPFFKRGPSPLSRFLLFSALSFALLAGDARFGYMTSVRQILGIVLYPLQQAALAPLLAWDRITGFFVTQAGLQRENARLKEENLAQAALQLDYAALAEENAHLRRLAEARQRYRHPTALAEILYAGRNPFNRRVVIDKGSRHGLEPGQPVADDKGLVGQVTRVLPWVAEVILITDKEQAVPVQVARSGARGIVFGAGRDDALDLPFTPISTDIRTGDTLVTSGIDGVYPPGLPVATVSNVERNAAYAFAKITCIPSAGVNRHTQLLVLTGKPERPPVPADSAETPAKRKKN